MTLRSGLELPLDPIREVCRRYAVRELSVFGSAVREEMHAESDIDILVDFEPGARIGLLKFASLAEDLEGILGRKVDLVTKRGLKPWVRPRILQEAELVFTA